MKRHATLRDPRPQGSLVLERESVRRHGALRLVLASVLLGGFLNTAQTQEPRIPALPPRPEVTQHEIIPILLLRCTVCHGLRRQEAGLDLRTKASMLKGGNSGPALIQGNPEASLMHKRIASGQCPPPLRVVEVSVKPMESHELALLAKWIQLGAPEIPDEFDAAGENPDPGIRDEDRQFWAFQTPKPVAIPRLSEAVRNPVDAFILEKLQRKGLHFSPPADAFTLIRRATLDLTGMPPAPEEMAAFLSDPDPAAYEKMIDRLLASPRYGERWARHWLDLAGYADSEGKREQDEIRPDAYRYRDYVIRSYNRDKPYDRFLLEQIAGDELADYTGAGEMTEALSDHLVATGFLRMAPDSTVAQITAFVPDRLDVIADAIEVLGSGVMGLTVGCARCHSHKFDPIPQRDYYRIAAALKGAYDEHDWLTPNQRRLPFVATAERRQWETRDQEIATEIESRNAKLNAAASKLKQVIFLERLAQLPLFLKEGVRQALETGANQRSGAQQFLAGKFEKLLRIDDQELKRLDATFKKTADEIQSQIVALEKQRPPEPKIRALWDRGEPSPTYLLTRGNYLTPGRLVAPGGLSILALTNAPFEIRPPWPGAKQTGRRLALAKWLTHPDHPLTARVMVNRIWRHHFEHGLVRSTGNFGRTGTPPTHPELLDWLASAFVRGGWSMKALHRVIMTSRTYRQSSVVTAESQQLDPGNDLLSRFPLKRMDAEVLADTILRVSGVLDETPFGPPDKVQVRADGLVSPAGTVRGWRRSIYVQQRRKEIPSILEVFDLPQMNPHCLERPNSVVASQALHLMNNALIRRWAESLALRVVREAGHDPNEQIRRLYLIAFSRPPTAEEEQLTKESLSQLALQWSAAAAAKNQRSAPEMEPLASLCHVLINSAEFIFID